MRRIMFLVGVVLGLSAPAGAYAQGGSSFSGGGGAGGARGGGGSSFSGGGGFSGGTSFSGGGSSFSGGGSSFSGGGMSGGGNTFSGGGQSFTGGGTFTGTPASGTTGAAGGGVRGGAGGSGFTPSTSNLMAATFSNPLWAGRPGSTNLSPKTLGGFGQATYGTTTAGNNTRAGARTGTANVNRGTTNQSNGMGIVAGTESPVTYALEVRFPAPPIASPRVQADLQRLINRTSQLRQPANVRVEVNGSVVFLRGRVADDDERRLVEAIVRLEPGVHEVQNDIEISSGPPK